MLIICVYFETQKQKSVWSNQGLCPTSSDPALRAHDGGHLWDPQRTASSGEPSVSGLKGVCPGWAGV
jgi:hypothetical protein